MSLFKCHVSHVTFYVSCVAYHLSCVMCQKSPKNNGLLSVEGLLSMGPTPSSLFDTTIPQRGLLKSEEEEKN